ncbi:hypothetical protein [Pseudotenacibaculum haliotis]|uniref:CdiI immunity protein domain-containing protein n=1 Tax=Pseudotenacibaculum haliotis TaxID=1862138 RepID=A0ABW5LQ20_9FLAO
MIINKRKITDLSKSENLRNEEKGILCAVLNAMNDWPNQFNDIEDFEKDIELFLGGEVNRLNIESVLKKERNLNDGGWKTEALASLNEIFNHESYQNLSLTQTIKLINSINN